MVVPPPNVKITHFQVFSWAILDIHISKFSPTLDLSKNTPNHSKNSPKLQKYSKNSNFSLQFFLSFIAILRPNMTHTGSPMFSKPPIESLNLHYYL